MSFRGSRVGRALVDTVPPTMDPTAPACSVSKTDNSTTGVNLTTDGTLDWWWPGQQTASSLPWNLAITVRHMKRSAPGWLFNNFRWQFGTGTVSALNTTSSRGMSITASDNLVSSPSNVNNVTNKTGYQTSTTGLVDFGFQLSLPISENQRRLRCYVVPSQCDVQLTATVWGNDGRTATDTQTVSAAAGVTLHSIFEVLFSGPSRGGRLVVDCRVITCNAASCNFCVQSFTLAEP